MTDTPSTKYKAQMKYRSSHVKHVNIDLFYGTDDDVIRWLESQPNKAAAIREAVRDKIASEAK